MHAQGHIRGAFIDWFDEGMPAEVPAEGPEHYFYDGKPRSARWLIGQLWHCTDVMPSDLCAELDMPIGSTYARAVQQIAAGDSASV